MLLIGLTGGIASGKSTVSSIFSKIYNVPIVDADLIARKGRLNHLKLKNVLENWANE